MGNINSPAGHGEAHGSLTGNINDARESVSVRGSSRWHSNWIWEFIYVHVHFLPYSKHLFSITKIRLARTALCATFGLADCEFRSKLYSLLQGTEHTGKLQISNCGPSHALHSHHYTAHFLQSKTFRVPPARATVCCLIAVAKKNGRRETVFFFFRWYVPTKLHGVTLQTAVMLIVTVIRYACQTRSVTLIEEHGLRM
jgi:hypothetical protein